ncbi:MAG: hypothetical protein GY705_25865 [Bacteroidetes bacterium]|nr:hypothetical protein [Bacteroidota bacterium]
MNTTDRLNSIMTKVSLLVSKLENLQSENASLSDENTRLKTALELENERVQLLKYKLEKVQQTMGENPGEEPEGSKKLKKQIDQYIKEIDKCIEWLQNA